MIQKKFGKTDPRAGVIQGGNECIITVQKIRNFNWWCHSTSAYRAVCNHLDSGTISVLLALCSST